MLITLTREEISAAVCKAVEQHLSSPEEIDIDYINFFNGNKEESRFPVMELHVEITI